MTFADQVTFEAKITRSFLPRTGDEFADIDEAKAYFVDIWRRCLEKFCAQHDAELLNIEEAEVPE